MVTDLHGNIPWIKNPYHTLFAIALIYSDNKIMCIPACESWAENARRPVLHSTIIEKGYTRAHE